MGNWYYDNNEFAPWESAEGLFSHEEIINNFKPKENKMKIKGMISVTKELPEVNKDVICFGIDEDGETKVEEGFRSAVDKDNKPHEWADFSYIVTHWIYSPVIEVDEKEANPLYGCPTCGYSISKDIYKTFEMQTVCPNSNTHLECKTTFGEFIIKE